MAIAPVSVKVGRLVIGKYQNLAASAILLEEVRVNKVVDTDTVEASETVRREELDIDSEGLPVVEKGNKQ
ncbi:MAG: DUF2382 domain-containing protein [Heteroscytonema crispum UTEX LB 1556]